MFSQGQLIFGILFFIAFVIAVGYSYKKDSFVHKSFYKGNYKIIIGFLVFIGMLFVIKIYLKH